MSAKSGTELRRTPIAAGLRDVCYCAVLILQHSRCRRHSELNQVLMRSNTKLLTKNRNKVELWKGCGDNADQNPTIRVRTRKPTLPHLGYCKHKSSAYHWTTASPACVQSYRGQENPQGLRPPELIYANREVDYGELAEPSTRSAALGCIPSRLRTNRKEPHYFPPVSAITAVLVGFSPPPASPALL
jgi:hypothetical protein